ncbi:MAG: site-2 protease family protein [Nitrospirae bacterium]|nr:site-2 protease family protein [Candidatus Manganitrophaceae bacterium]
MEPESEGPKIPEVREIFQGGSAGNGIAPPIQQEAWAVSEEAEEKTRLTVPILLFIGTVFTTLIAGSYLEGGDPFRHPADLARGIAFSFTLMSILFVHEMGHYVTSKRYGIKTTPPYFIPGPWLPFGIGTFGAFIRMRSPILKKNALLDIGAAGPIAGFVVSIVAVGIGLYTSKIVEIEEGNALIRLGDPLIFSFMAYFLGKVPPAGYDVALSSMAFAGWFGLFVTSLNLLPIGQLDGGHIMYALLGKKQRFLSMAMVLVLILLGAMGWSGWYVWAILTSILGIRHPPIVDEEAPLDFKHQLIGWASIALFIVTFMPAPFKVS